MSDEGCMPRCCRCLASIPCSSMMSWVMLVVSTSACGGALMIAAQRTERLLDNEQMFWYSEPVCLGVIFGMAFIATIFLVLATISSRPLSANVFPSRRKTNCAKALQIIIMFFQLLLLVGWAGVTCLISVPVTFITLLFILNYRGDICVDLMNYGLTSESVDICGSSLTRFIQEANSTFECYVIALVAAILVILSLVFLLMCTTANFIYLRESGSSEYSVYQNEVAHSKNSVLDTRM